jgi:hypothetical protein
LRGEAILQVDVGRSSFLEGNGGFVRPTNFSQ